jgi:CelD/BcsL family acetyltransferase involved in cellulose biosynthesis
MEVKLKNHVAGPELERVSVQRVSGWNQVMPFWSELALTSPYSSFFLSPEWVESWLETFGPVLKPEILVFESQEQVVGTCLLVRQTAWQGPLRVSRIYLNTAGEDEADSPCVEFNNILCREGWEHAVAAALFAHLKPQPWDEIAGNGFSKGPMLDALATVFADFAQEVIWRSSYYVDLARLREVNASYDTALSRKWRQHLRRSMKLYEQIGELRVEPSEEVSKALEMLDHLSALHQRTWVGRGKPGAFASPRFLDFHRRLIRRSVPKQEVELLRVAAGQETVGFRYNFVQRGKVHCYQSGLNYHDDDRYKPGLVVHGCAIHYYQKQGLNEYDFLAGDAQFKKSLSTNSRPLAWVLFRRRNLKFRAIEDLRKIKATLRTYPKPAVADK